MQSISVSEPARTSEASAPRWFFIFLLFFAVSYLADFLYFKDFGIYEDDYLFTLDPANWTVRGWWQNMIWAVSDWHQGRPVWWIINPTLAWLCGMTGTLASHYLLLLSINAAVAFLICRLLSRYFTIGPAIYASLFFILYPSDASGPIIMHTTNYFLVLGITLGALHMYLARFRVACLGVAVLVLLSYEPYFLFFFLFPFLDFFEDGRIDWKASLRHWIILLVIFAAVIFFRNKLGDDRSASMIASLGEVLEKALKAPFIGAWTTLRLSVQRPLEALWFGPIHIWAVASFSGILLFFTHNPTDSRIGFCRPTGRSSQIEGKRLIWFGVLGLVFFLMPYAYRWHDDYYPPVVSLGRLSAMHIPSALGACMIIAAGLGALKYAPVLVRRTISYAGVIYLALLIAVGVNIQLTDYVKNWDQQQTFWLRVFELTQDLHEDDVIVVDINYPPGAPTDPRPGTAGLPSFWIVNYAPNFLTDVFYRPLSWKKMPQVFGYWKDTKASKSGEGLKLETPNYWSSEKWPVLIDNKFIWLEWQGMRLERVTRPITIAGYTLKPRDVAARSFWFPPRPAFHLLFPRQQQAWPSIRNGLNYPP